METHCSQRFFQKGAANLLVIIGLLILGLLIPASVKLTEREQEIRSEAVGESCGGAGSYCQPNFYGCNSGETDIGQSNCADHFHCCDPSVPTPTSQYTCAQICGQNYHSCGTPTEKDGYDCTVVSTHIGDTTDCLGTCYCSYCRVVTPTPAPVSTSTPTSTPTPVCPASFPANYPDIDHEELCKGTTCKTPDERLNVYPGDSLTVSFSHNSVVKKVKVRYRTKDPVGSWTGGTGPISASLAQGGLAFAAPPAPGVYQVLVAGYPDDCEWGCSNQLWYTFGFCGDPTVAKCPYPGASKCSNTPFKLRVLPRPTNTPIPTNTPAPPHGCGAWCAYYGFDYASCSAKKDSTDECSFVHQLQSGLRETNCNWRCHCFTCEPPVSTPTPTKKPRPTTTTAPPSQPLVCQDLMGAPVQDLSPGDTISLTCLATSDPSDPITHFEFRVIKDNQTEPIAVEEMTGSSGIYQAQSSYLFPDYGCYTFQCKACTSNGECSGWSQ